MSAGSPPGAGRYLAEWYQPALSEALLEQTAHRISCRTAELRCEGTAVDVLLTLFMPDDEVAFCLFAAPSLACVELACRRADLPYGRITRAITSPCAQPSEVA
jgi:Protein of unknown function (DUF4242)